MKKLVYILGDNSIIEKETGDVVMYGDDVVPEVLSNVVEMYNKGKSIREIDQYLLDEKLSTQEEREFIVENINNYINMEGQMTPVEVAETLTAMVNNTTTVDEIPGTNIAAILPGFATEPGTPAPVEKQKKTWTRRSADIKSTVKMQSTEDFIKVMQEKIEMAKMLDSIELPELPGSMTKVNRDVMVEFQKEHSVLIIKYMQKIQQA